MKTIISHNPSQNFKVLGEVEVTSKEELHQIFENAQEAKYNWKQTPVSQRVELLTQSFESMKSRRDELASCLSLEMGMPISQAQDEVEYGLGYFQWYLENAESMLSSEILKETDGEIHTVFYEPKGVVAAIAPWNFPTFLFVWSSIQALLAGNTVIFKSSKETILTGKMIEEIMRAGNLPEGVFQEIYGSGELGDMLTDLGVDFIHFTGSTEVGKKLYLKAAEKMIQCTMELGGSAPGIICKDADIDAVIDSVYIMKFLNAGQVCDGLKRLIVHESHYNEVVEKLSKLIQSKKIGDASEIDTDIGPLVSLRQRELLGEQVQDAVEKGATILAENIPPQNLEGAYTSALLLGNITSDMKVWKEEVFGPVLPIVKFSTQEEALELANDTVYGLGGYIFTKDIDTLEYFSEHLKTGMIQHNNLNYCQPQNPFGGYKLSGVGREHGTWGFHEVCNIKVISRQK